ncbi:methyltransferase domain-containing protein [Hyphomonas oceanitis]|uniref:Methyltransferase domain-containing protein n=1 Tax=Hyphomonas oceanitis SCH89 TaxID=1280953 RepID=A0A059G9F4_9PROT|nr:methyltransferase domain-containing protein [Hyphomonas oceanitis]KDA03426.1 hypothetical protein HOC_06073 [Hyphomonas oceanitis SCH89]
MMKSLVELANDFGSDKGTLTGDAHTYAYIYDLLFTPLRRQSVTFCEIGLQRGGPEHKNPNSRATTDVPSVRMWDSYFPDVQIYGLDISDFSAFEKENFRFHQVDCGDAEQLERVADQLPEMDVILDDASHASYHQQLTLTKLFRKLKPGGIYIIEDVNWQPEHMEEALPNVVKTAELFKRDTAPSQALSAEVWAMRDQFQSLSLISNASLEAHRRYYNATVLNTVSKRDAARDAFGKMVERNARGIFRGESPNRDYEKLIIFRKA